MAEPEPEPEGRDAGRGERQQHYDDKKVSLQLYFCISISPGIRSYCQRRSGC